MKNLAQYFKVGNMFIREKALQIYNSLKKTFDTI